MSDPLPVWGELDASSTDAGPCVYHDLSAAGRLRVWIERDSDPEPATGDERVSRPPDFEGDVHDLALLRDGFGGIAVRTAISSALLIGVEAALRSAR